MSLDAKPPAACVSKADVRDGVGAVDRALVELLTVRQGYMEAAARIKPTRDQVRDPARIEQVVARVLPHARGCGLSEAIAERVWRILTEQCIAHEQRAFDART